MTRLQQPFLQAEKEAQAHEIVVGSCSRQETVSTTASDNDGCNHRLTNVKGAGWLQGALQHPLCVPLVFVSGLFLGALTFMAVHQFSQQEVVSSAGATYPSVAAPATVPAEYFAAKPLDNSCLIHNMKVPDGPQTFDACEFVIRSTDEVWNLRGDVTAAIEKYFHEDYVNAGSWGRRGIGKKALHEAVLAEMRAFPDIRIHITDCVCRGNDVDGYKCAMPDILDGTNMGPSAYGPATGKYARWTGIVESLVQKNAKTGQWQYVAEWGVHDEWALIQQLGLDFSKVPHPVRNTEPLHDCHPLLNSHPRMQMDSIDEANMQAHHQAVASANRASLRAGKIEKHP